MNRSEENTFRVTDIELRQFAGVNPGNAFKLEGLSPHINIIYGSNGCGKSTTAAALQSLVWPSKSEEFRETHASISVSGEKWELRLRGKEVEAFKEEIPHPLPLWAASETRSRYHWSLQNLLRDQDRDLANQVAKEMAGGIDFQELAHSLNGTKKPSAPQKLHQQYLAAEKRLRSAKEAQQALLTESKKMDKLRSQLEQAEKVVAKSAIIGMARELNEKGQALVSVKEELSEFAPGMSKLRGDDAQNLEEMIRYVEERKEKQTVLQEQRAALGTGESAWATFGEDNFQAASKEITHLLSQWEDDQRKLKETTLRLTENEAREQALRVEMCIQPQAALDLETGFNFPKIREWIRIVFKHLNLQAQKQTLLQDLPPDSVDAPANLESLRDARKSSESWLKAQTPTPSKDHAAFILSMLMLSVVLVYLCSHYGLSWGLLLVIAPPPALHFLLHRRKNKAWIDSIQTQFPEEISQPEIWTEESVRQILKQIDDDIQSAYDHQAINRDRRRLASIETALIEVSQEMDAISSTLENAGLDLENDPEWMAHFLTSVQDWRRLRNESAATEAVKDQQESEQSKIADELRLQFRKWAQSEKEGSLQSISQQLLDRMESEVGRRREMNLLEIRLKQQAQQRNEKQESIQKLCERVQISGPDLPTLKSRVAALETWQSLFRRSETLQARISELRNELGTDRHLSELSPERIIQEVNACDVAKQKANELRDQISKLEQRIHDQQKGRGIHEAEEALAGCREELEAEREANLQIRLGMEITAWLQDQCRSRDRSAVLEEANKNLRIFSNTTLQLHLSLEKSGGEFRASKPGHVSLALSKLSSGERTQVLMAVRLAFLRLNEHAPLPLLVDEALGTSDDDRSEQIIKALIDVSKQGRQIFYFTAQQDEVEKWRQISQTSSIQPAFIDLASIRGQARPINRPLRVRPEIQKADPKKQDDEDHKSWAERLGISGWNPHQPVDDLALWWLLQDHETLFSELYQREIHLVGQWDMYAATDAYKNKPGTDTLNQKIRFIRALQKEWSVGRSKPIPEQALLDSGAVTDRFVSDVITLAQELEGDAGELIEGLKSKKVSGFQKQKITDLESYMFQQGYLTDQQPLEKHEAIAKVIQKLGDVTPETHRIADLVFD